MSDDPPVFGEKALFAVRQFPLRRSRLAWPFVGLLAPGGQFATVGPSSVAVRVGLLGRAEIPLDLIDRISTMQWPWMAGVGVRISRGLVAFVPASGECVVIETAQPVSVRAPLKWTTSRVAIAVEDVEGFAEAIAEARRSWVDPSQPHG
jgi:hypothetical protein